MFKEINHQITSCQIALFRFDWGICSDSSFGSPGLEILDIIEAELPRFTRTFFIIARAGHYMYMEGCLLFHMLAAISIAESKR